LYEAITRTTNYAKNICEDPFFLTERYFSTFFMPCNHPPTTMRSYFQHIFLQPIFFFAVLSNINGGAPSDPCHFLKVTKTCEQPQVLAIVLPNSSINESKNKCMHAPGINLSMASSTSTLMPTLSAFLLQFSNLNFLGHQCLNPKLQHKEAHIANLSGKDEIK